MSTEEPDPDVSMGGISRPIDELDAQRVFAELSSAIFDREVEPARVGRFVLLGIFVSNCGKCGNMFLFPRRQILK